MDRTIFVVLLALLGSISAQSCRNFDKDVIKDLLDPISDGLGSSDIIIESDEFIYPEYDFSMDGGKIGGLRSMVPFAGNPVDDPVVPKICFNDHDRTVSVTVEFQDLSFTLDALFVETPYIKINISEPVQLNLLKSTASMLVSVTDRGTATLDELIFSIGSTEVHHETGFVRQCLDYIINSSFAPAILEFLKTSGVESAIEDRIKTALAKVVIRQQENIYKLVPKF